MKPLFINNPRAWLITQRTESRHVRTAYAIEVGYRPFWWRLARVLRQIWRMQ